MKKSSILRNIFSILALLAATLTMTGCMTTSSGNPDVTSIQIHLRSDGKFTIDDKTVSLDKLEKTIRKTGATPATTLYINIPATYPMSNLTSLTQRLASAGYRRVFYKRPQIKKAQTTSPP
jgi:biopolymer transport protein ExbD